VRQNRAAWSTFSGIVTLQEKRPPYLGPEALARSRSTAQLTAASRTVQRCKHMNLGPALGRAAREFPMFEVES
jgi:hypothetical protein